MKMANSRTFEGVTPQIWEDVKANSLKEHGTIYQSTGPTIGTAITKVTAIGTILLNYNYDAPKDTVTYNIEKKPGIVSANQIWNGIQSTIDGCRAK